MKLFLNISLEETAHESHAIVIDREFGDAEKVEPWVLRIEIATEDSGVPVPVLSIAVVSEAFTNFGSHGLCKLRNRVSDRRPAFNLLLKQVESMLIQELCSVRKLVTHLFTNHAPAFDNMLCSVDG